MPISDCHKNHTDFGQVIIFAAFGSWLSGYGLAVIIATVGQPSFYASLGLDPDPISPGYGYTRDIIATVQGIFFAGGAFGCLFAGAVGNRLGRIRSLQLSVVICVVGAAIQTGAVAPAMVRHRTCLRKRGWRMG